MDTTKIVLFKNQKIRKTIHNNEWWFSVVDVVQALIDQPDDTTARKYWNKLAERLREEGSKLVTFCHQLKLPASDGKYYETDCANTEGLFRIIQSIPSPKAEPFKRWLAKVGYERAKEDTDYEILTAEISKATFGVTPAEYKKLKGLKRQNLRDHMDDFELIFNMLGERATTEIHRNEDSKGIPKLKSDAKAGGEIAGGAREKLEKRLGHSVVTKKNFLK
jgi:DNA-damage-inducible protein D